MKQRIPFVGPSYQARSSNADAQRALNCYVEFDQSSPRAPMALYGTPGLNRQFTLATNEVRGGVVEDGYLWMVAGNKVYKIDSSYTITTIGTINTSSGTIGMATNGQQILIVDGTNGYTIAVPLSTLTQIADADFPNGVRRATYQDGYFIVTGDGTQKFYISSLYDGSTWDGLDFASAEGSPDDTVGCISDHRELWLFGDNSAEIWVNTGNSDFPFERSVNAFIEHGCAAAATIAKLDNTVFWLGSDDRGLGIVWRASGYVPQRVSNHAIEKAISGYTTISDAFAFTYQQEGHAFYVLTFPSAAATWVYDVATQLWHERAYRNPSDNTLQRWRANCHVMFNGKHLVGDCFDGRVYSLDMDTYTDDGDAILRLRASQTEEALQNRLFYNTLQVDMETGVGLESGADPQMMLRYSNDGGHSWSDYRTSTVGKVGEYGARCRFNRLGAGRNRVWEISMTDPVKFAVIGAVVDAEPGNS